MIIIFLNYVLLWNFFKILLTPWSISNQNYAKTNIKQKVLQQILRCVYKFLKEVKSHASKNLHFNIISTPKKIFFISFTVRISYLVFIREYFVLDKKKIEQYTLTLYCVIGIRRKTNLICIVSRPWFFGKVLS